MSELKQFSPAPGQLITTWGLFQTSFKFLGRHWQKLIALIVPILLPRFIDQTIRIWLAFKFNQGFILSDFWERFFFYFFPSLTLVSIIISLWGSIALIIFINEDDPYFKVATAYRQGLRLFFSYLWIAILSALIIIGGLILLVIPGIIWAINYSLAIYPLIAENLKGRRALKRSRELVRNYWWPVFFKTINLFLAIILLSLPYVLVNSFTNSPTIAIFNLAYDLIYSFLIIIVSTSYFFYLYQDLRRLKD